MKVNFTARHCEVSPALRERAEELMGRIDRKAGRITRAEVIFDSDHDKNIVEITLQFARGRTKVGKAEADDFRTALDSAVSKIENNLDKTRPGSTRRAVGEG